MTVRKTWLYAVAAVSLLLGGCVTHTPISESAIFHDAATHPSHDRTSGFGFVGTYSPARSAAVHLAEREYPEWAYRSQDLPLNANRFSGGLYFASFDRAGRYGVSVTAGAFVAGIDGTLKLWDRNYLTAAVSAPGQGQLFLQHRTFNSPSIGAAFGVGYQRDAFTFDVPSECMCRIESKGVDSFGVRGFAILRSGGDTGGGLKVGTYLGYMPTLERPVLSITLTAGRF